jgi:hypothetical protein
MPGSLYNLVRLYHLVRRRALRVRAALAQSSPNFQQSKESRSLGILIHVKWDWAHVSLRPKPLAASEHLLWFALAGAK